MKFRTTRSAAMAAFVVASALLAATPAAHAAPQNPLPAPPPPPKLGPDPKQTLFFKELNDQGVPYTSAPDAIKMAQTTCQILGTGSPTKIQDAAQRLQDTGNMRPEQIHAFAFAAIGVFCPGVKLN